MGKRIQREVVPPRDERLAEIGGPKAPKMGTITPKTVEVPEVGDLLKELKAAAPVRNFMRGELDPREQGGPCRHGCNCGPCRSRDCGNCLVDAQRNADRSTVRSYVAYYRGVVLP